MSTPAFICQPEQFPKNTSLHLGYLPVIDRFLRLADKCRNRKKTKGCERMSEKEKTICKNLEKALSSIPEAKKEYFLGFAEGVDAAKKKQEETQEKDS